MPAPVLELRSKWAIPDNGKPPPVKSTVGLVLDNTAVSMVVPGGPAYKPVNGKQIEKTDIVIAIDPDGKSGLKPVAASTIIPLLRGPDKVGSMVTLQVTKSSTKETLEFAMKRADFRQVEKIKDVYMKLAELSSAAKAPKPDVIQKISKELETNVGALNDWTSMVESLLRDHVADLEDLVTANLQHIQALEQDAAEQVRKHAEELQKQRAAAEEERVRLEALLNSQKQDFEDQLKRQKELAAKLEDEYKQYKQSAEAQLAATKQQALQDVRERDNTITKCEDEIEDLKRRLKSLEGELASAQAALEKGGKLAADKDAEIKSLSSALAARDAELADTKRQLQQVRE